jgi:hypothetical protein
MEQSVQVNHLHPAEKTGTAYLVGRAVTWICC